jgi:iron complex outermembrane receptor protein
MSVRNIPRPLACLPLALCVTASAAAQEIDIGAMERLFGEPVTTSATGAPQRASDAPADMDIITQDDIRRSGATNIPDVLQFVPGVDVRRYGIADAEVGIRGYNQPYNPRLLVLVNGRQVYTDDYGHVSWPTIPVQLAEIRQIEIIKGPSSALYGFNAVGGVINIVTYDPLHDALNSATLWGGSQSYLGGSVVGTGQIGNDFGVRLSAGGLRAHDFDSSNLSPGDAAGRNLSPQVGTFAADMRAHMAPGIETFAEASAGDSRYAEQGVAGQFDTAFTRTNAVRLGATADTSAGLLSVGAYRNETLVSLLTSSFTAANLAAWEREDVYVVQASDLVKLGLDHTLRVGLEYRNNNGTAPGFFHGTIGYSVYAASVMWNWTITPGLSLTNAVRVDDLHLNYSGVPAVGSGLSVGDYNHAGFAIPSFNSGLVYRPTDEDTFRLLAARGVQVPSLVDFGLQFSAGEVGPVVIAGNPNVNPSTVDNLELDYDRDVRAIDSTLRIALFIQRTRNIIIEPAEGNPVIGPLGLPLFLAANVGNSDAAGMEIGIKGHSASGYRWTASYALVSTTDGTDLNMGAGPTTPIDYAHSVPRHVVTAGVGYTWQKLELDLMGRWQSSYLDYQSLGLGSYLTPVEIDNYVTLNARAGYRLTDNVTVGLTAQQFNTSRLLRAAGPPVTRMLLGSITAHF